MLAVILKILSIIGIVLLCLLGLLLVLVILVLVLPVRYSVKASKKDEDAELQASFKLTYFFRILRAYALYEKKVVSVTVKVLWFKLFSMRFPEEEDEGEEYDLSEFDSLVDEEFPDDDFEMTADDGAGLAEGEDAADGDSDAGIDSAEGESPDGSTDEESLGEEDVESVETAEDGVSDYSEADAEGSEAGSDTDGDDPGFFSKIKFKVEEIYDKIDKVRSELRYYRNVLHSNEAAYAYRAIKKRLGKILKKVLPRKVRADLIYGFSSPDVTGKVYGLYCIFRKRLTKGSRVIPDFEKEVFIGYIEAKGHFNLFGILVQGIALLLNRNIWKIYKSLKHHRNKDNSEADNAGARSGGSKAA